MESGIKIHSFTVTCEEGNCGELTYDQIKYSLQSRRLREPSLNSAKTTKVSETKRPHHIKV